MKFLKNIILNTDSCKISTFKPKNENINDSYFYVESRGGKYNSTMLFGLQSFIKEYLLEPITRKDIDYAYSVFKLAKRPFNKEDWQYILNQHNGYLPLIIRSVEEGTVIPVDNILLTIESSDPKCTWLIPWLESSLLRAIWYPSTVATQSWYIRQIILHYLEVTGDPRLIDFKLYNFGTYGISSMESTSIGGAAHLVNFMGTDNIAGVLHACEYYNANISDFVVAPMEHSNSTQGYSSNETVPDCTVVWPDSGVRPLTISVSSSYHIPDAIDRLSQENIRTEIKKHGALVVILPGSGDPEMVSLKLLHLLHKKFGANANEKGFFVLNNIRLAHNNNMSDRTIRNVLGSFAAHGYSADNIIFGVSGTLFQQMDRNTQKFTISSTTLPNDIDYLETVFTNGKLIKEITFDQIRSNSKIKH